MKIFDFVEVRIAFQYLHDNCQWFIDPVLDICRGHIADVALSNICWDGLLKHDISAS